MIFIWLFKCYIGLLMTVKGTLWGAGISVIPIYDFFRYKTTWKQYQKWLDKTFSTKWGG